MKYFIQQALTDWAYKVNDGCPDPQNRTHIQVLEAVLRQHGCTEEFISEYLPRVEKLHELDFKDKAAFNAYSDKHNIKPDTKVTIGGVETTAGEAEKDTSDSKTEKSSAGVRGNLSDIDNQDKHDILQHGYDGARKYYEKEGIKDIDGGEKKPAPGNAGSAFNEIVSGEGVQILTNNPDMTEEELAREMFNDFGGTALGQEQSKTSGIPIPDDLKQARKDAKANGDKQAIIKAERNIASYTKCVIAARSAKAKYNTTQNRVQNLQEQGKFGKPNSPETFYGSKKSLQAQQDSIDKADRVILPNGIEVTKEDAKYFVSIGGGGANPSDTATFISDDKGNLMIQFHSDKTSTKDQMGSKAMNAEMDGLRDRIESNKNLTPERKKAAMGVVDEYNTQMKDIEANYGNQTTSIAKNLEDLPIKDQVEVIEEQMAKPPHRKQYLDNALFGKKGLHPKYEKYLPEGADPNNLTNEQKLIMIRSLVANPDEKKSGKDIKVVSKIAEHLSKKMGDDAPDNINIKKVMAQRRKEVVDLQRDRKDELNKVDEGPPPLGDLQEAEETIDGLHLDVLDDRDYDKDEPNENKRLKGIMSSAFDVNMGGVIANGEILRKCLGVGSLQELKDNFNIVEEEKYTTDDGTPEGNVTGKVIFTYVVNSETGGKTELAYRTYRSSDGPTGKTRTLIQYTPEFQQKLVENQ